MLAALPLLHVPTSTNGWWHWHVHADVVLLCVFLEVGYLYAVTQLRPLVSDAGRVKRMQVATFSAGVFSMWLAAGTPIHDVSEQYLLSAHMFEHAIIALVTEPLLLAGIPSWMWQVPLRWRGVLPVARVIVHPVFILIVVNMAVVVLHLPAFMDYALNHHPAHFWFHVVLLLTSMLMWWPVLSNVPELPRASYPIQMAYLFVQSLVPTVVSGFITFADSTVYSYYDRVPRLWGITTVTDQQIGGGVMKTMGALIIWWFIGLAFFRWYRDAQAAETGPSWTTVESELEELGFGRKRQ